MIWKTQMQVAMEIKSPSQWRTVVLMRHLRLYVEIGMPQQSKRLLKLRLCSWRTCLNQFRSIVH